MEVYTKKQSVTQFTHLLSQFKIHEMNLVLILQRCHVEYIPKRMFLNKVTAEIQNFFDSTEKGILRADLHLNRNSNLLYGIISDFIFSMFSSSSLSICSTVWYMYLCLYVYLCMFLFILCQ